MNSSPERGRWNELDYDEDRYPTKKKGKLYGTRNQKKNQDHSDHNSVKMRLNTLKNPKCR